jgi:2-polyprenyl-3-methyl-5-hydroxy-6-metoxy-1,4-benzoquinol methylase
MLSAEQVERMRAFPAFRDSPTGFLDPAGALDYFRRRYADILAGLGPLRDAVLLDAGCHEGWNLLAFLLAGGRKALGVDMNREALGVAHEFARIAGVRERLFLAHASVTELPFADRSVDLVSCIEVLEHLGGADRGREALRELARVARRVVLVSTPNKLSPVVAHDTRLPFAHWLPPRLRRPYAKLFRRTRDDEGNVFLGPFTVDRSLAGFRRRPGFLGFPTLREFEACFPHYLPYMGEGVAGVRGLGKAKRAYYRTLNALLGRHSYYVLPSLTAVFARDGERDGATGSAAR